jgi:hypothetical protein
VVRRAGKPLLICARLGFVHELDFLWGDRLLTGNERRHWLLLMVWWW